MTPNTNALKEVYEEGGDKCCSKCRISHDGQEVGHEYPSCDCHTMKQKESSWEKTFALMHSGVPEEGSAGWYVSPASVKQFINTLLSKVERQSALSMLKKVREKLPNKEYGGGYHSILNEFAEHLDTLESEI